MDTRQILVVGNGMVGQRFVDQLVAADTEQTCAITVIGEESRPAYDRVALSSWFNGKSEEDLRLVRPELLTGDRVDYRFGRLVEEIDHMTGKAILDDGSLVAYDELVIATGSYPFVPPVAGPRSRGLLRLPHARRPRPDPHAGPPRPAAPPAS